MKVHLSKVPRKFLRCKFFVVEKAWRTSSPRYLQMLKICFMFASSFNWLFSTYFSLSFKLLVIEKRCFNVRFWAVLSQLIKLTAFVLWSRSSKKSTIALGKISSFEESLIFYSWSIDMRTYHLKLHFMFLLDVM